MMRLQEKYEGDYDKMLEQPVTKRDLKSMGHTKPSKDTIKDILVMHKCERCHTLDTHTSTSGEKHTLPGCCG
ncbi:hypothetical protein K1719_024093 [Acacia pycnantha]|nr:hypothetical protein K1719_024093 [Acacia pycnantha]